jgi:hypothetical protein
LKKAFNLSWSILLKACDCDLSGSIGMGCDPKTGNCECMPGMKGKDCDVCPPRHDLIPHGGCFQCDTCTHHLWDRLDRLKDRFGPIAIEIEVSM